MARVIRKVVVVVLSVAVYAAAWRAPFVHAHLDDHETDHHDARAVHAHFSPHAHSAPSPTSTHVEDGDGEHVLLLQLFVAVTSSGYDIPVAVAEWFELTPPEASAHRPVFVVHGHDPPLHSSLASRAPPSHLS